MTNKKEGSSRSLLKKLVEVRNELSKKISKIQSCTKLNMQLKLDDIIFKRVVGTVAF